MDRPHSAFARKDVAAINRHHRSIRLAACATIESLERRCLLTVNPTDPAYVWAHLKPAAEQDLAILEYIYPQFDVRLDAQLAALGLTPIAPQAGTLPGLSDAAKGKLHRHPRPLRPHKLNVYHAKPHRRPHKSGPTPPTVTDVNYYYDQALPNQLAFTFDEDVAPATTWDAAITVLNLDTGATLATSGTYSSALHTVVYNLNSSAELPSANYAAILHSSQITDTTYGLPVVGSDSVPGDDFAANFFFQNADFNHDRQVSLADFSILAANYGMSSGATFSSGDANYNGSVSLADFNILAAEFGVSLPLLTAPDAPTSTNGNTRMEIAWDAPADTNVTEFDVYRNSTRIASDVTATSFLDTGLSPGTTYDYLVVSRDGNGDSSWQSPELVTATPAITSLTVTPPALAAITVDQTFGLSTTFNDTGSLTTHTANIAWGDGTTGTAIIVESSNSGTLSGNHVYDGFGAYFGTVTVTDPNGSVATEVFEVIVPTFYNSGDGDGFVVGTPYALTPTFSDPDGSTPESYYIAWGDGSSTQTYAGLAADFTHDFTSAVDSPFDATVAVLAADGTFTDYPEIAEVPPTLSITGDSGVTEGSVYDLTASVSGAYSGDSFSWTIYWGDDDSSPSDYSGAPGVFTHTYSDDESFTVDVLVSDDTSGEGDIQELTNSIADAIPLTSFSSTGNATIGIDASFTDGFSDPGGATLDNLSIAWGDGQSDAYYLDPHTVDHTYDAPGTYTGTAIFSDSDGTYAESFVRAVANDYTFTASGDDATAGATYTLDTSFQDPAGDTLTSYTVAWGDGDTDTYSDNPDTQGTFVHVYDPTIAPSTVTATVTGYDDEGGTFIASTTVNVTDAEPTFSFSDTGEAEGGVDFYVDATYGPTDGVSYTFSIAWGDGSSGEQAGPTFSHEYSYDTSPLSTNEHTFTITASTDTGWEETYSGFVQVNAAGSGSGSVFGDGSSTQGIDYELTANFSGGSGGAAAWVISWGDGNVDTYDLTGGATTHFVVSHEYDSTGSFDIEGDALYTDASYDCEYVATDSVTVEAGATPTLTATGDTTATVTGDTYSVAYSWTSFFDDSVAYWTVAWGDGKSVIYRDDPSDFYHVYTTASTSGTNYDVEVTASTTAGHTYTADTSLLVAQPALHVLNDDGSQMNDADLATDGVFIGLDDSDDDGLEDTSGNSIPNDSQTSMTSTDLEMVEVTLGELPASVGGTYSLSWDSSDFTVWADHDKDTRILTGAAFVPSAGASVFLEGVGISARMIADELFLNFTADNGHSVPNVARAPLTVVKFDGPQIVPAYGSFTYTAQGAIPADVVNADSWVMTGGTATHWDAEKKQLTVMWNGGGDLLGPTVGNIDYEWDGSDQHGIRVDVVYADVSNPTGGAFSPGKPKDNGPPAQDYGVLRKSVISGTIGGTPGASWSAAVTLEGPTVGGHNNVGVNKIEVGFVQNVTSFTSSGSYVGGVRTSSLQAKVAAEGPMLDAASSSIVWYSNATGTIFQNASPTNLSATISANDTPSNGPPLWRNNKILNQITFAETFVVSVAAHIKGSTGSDKAVFVPFADAAWTFNGNGAVAPATPNTWTAGPAAADTVPPGWTLVHPPTLMVTTGKTMNQLRWDERFSN